MKKIIFFLFMNVLFMPLTFAKPSAEAFLDFDILVNLLDLDGSLFHEGFTNRMEKIVVEEDGETVPAPGFSWDDVFSRHASSVIDANRPMLVAEREKAKKFTKSIVKSSSLRLNLDIEKSNHWKVRASDQRRVFYGFGIRGLQTAAELIDSEFITESIADPTEKPGVMVAQMLAMKGDVEPAWSSPSDNKAAIIFHDIHLLWKMYNAEKASSEDKKRLLVQIRDDDEEILRNTYLWFEQNKSKFPPEITLAFIKYANGVDDYDVFPEWIKGEGEFDPNYQANSKISSKFRRETKATDTTISRNDGEVLSLKQLEQELQYIDPAEGKEDGGFTSAFLSKKDAGTHQAEIRNINIMAAMAGGRLTWPSVSENPIVNEDGLRALALFRQYGSFFPTRTKPPARATMPKLSAERRKQLSLLDDDQYTMLKISTLRRQQLSLPDEMKDSESVTYFDARFPDVKNEIVTNCDAVIARYTENKNKLYLVVNFLLFSGGIKDYPAAQQYVRELDYCIEQQQAKHEGMVYRGAVHSPMEIAGMALKRIFYFPNFVSTSTSPNAAYDQNVLYEIELSYNARSAKIMPWQTQYHEEEEVLLASYNRFEYVSSRLDREIKPGHEVFVIRLRVVDPKLVKPDLSFPARMPERYFKSGSEVIKNKALTSRQLINPLEELVAAYNRGASNPIKLNLTLPPLLMKQEARVIETMPK